MDCIHEAENRLRYYRDLRRSVQNNRRVISKLTYGNGPKDMGAAKLDVTGIHSNRPHDTLNQMYQLQLTIEMMKETEAELKHLDKILDEISKERGCEQYKELLILWYVDKLPKEDIAEKLNYSVRQSVYDMRKKAIRKFAVSLFGIKAVESI